MTETLNKTAVSNEITGLRPMVKQAVVHIAHHLTREIRKCESRKGEKNRSKFENRAKHLRQEVVALKDLNHDTISRYALQMDFSEREKILNDVKVPLEIKVMVRVATHKSVMNHIQDFRALYPEWKAKVQELIENLGIRTKFKKKVKKQIEKNQAKLRKKIEMRDSSDTIVKKCQKMQHAKKMEEGPVGSNERNDSVEESDGDTEENDSEEGSDGVNEENDFMDQREESEEESGDEEISSGEEDSSLLQETKVDEESACKTKENGLSRRKQSQITTLSKPQKRKISVSLNAQDSEELSDEEGDESGEGSESSMSASEFSTKHNICSSESVFAEVRPFSELLKSISSDESKDSGGRHTSGNDCDTYVEDEEKVDDPFFVTEGNDFLKTAAVRRDNGEGLGQHFQRKHDGVKDTEDLEEPQKWEKAGVKIVVGNRAQRRAKLFGKEPTKHKCGKGKASHNSKFDSNFSGSPMQFAKRQKFEGGSEDNLKSRSFGPAKVNRKNFRDSINQSAIEHSLSDKMRNKPGKRIGKFGENGNEGRVNTNSDTGDKLHPSWEAKRKQKVIMNNFQGKKIKFEED